MPLVLFAIPDQDARENRFEIAIPNGASLILKHDRAGVVPGLNDFVAADGTIGHPPVAPVFYAFRIMVGVGFLMLAVAWSASWLLWRRGEPGTVLTVALVGMTFSGWVATIAGWYVTEIGRQPWLVTGVLSTADAVTRTASAGMVWTTLVMYLAIYAVLLAAFIGTLFHLATKAASAGPHSAPIAQGGEQLAGASAG